MEENPDNQMEMDVSSTTQDIPVIQEDPGPTNTVQVTITTVKVEEIKEDDQDHNIDSNTPESKPSSPQVLKISSDTETPVDRPVQTNPSKVETTPAKIEMPQTPTKPVNRRNVILVQASSADSQSSNVAGKSIIPVEKLVQTSPSKIETTTFKKTEAQTATKPIIKWSTPPKLVHASSADSLSSFVVEVSTITDELVQKTPEKLNMVKKDLDLQFQNTSEKPPVKEIVIEDSPVKEIVIEKTPVKEIVIEKTPVKEIIIEKTSTKQKVIENPAVKEITIVKETTVENNSVKEKVVETTPVKETANVKSLEKSLVIEKDTEKIPEKVTTVKSSIKENVPLEEKSSEKTPVKVKAVENTVNKEKTLENSLIEESSSENSLVDTIPLDSGSGSASTPENVNTKRDEVIVVVPLEYDNDDDSQADTLTSAASESSEKDRKSLNRELKSLIKSAKESKIINECTQIKTKIRKSRATLDTSNSSLNASADAEKIQGSRRDSSNSQKSSCSEKSEKANLKRSMRSQNPEFVIKNKQFLNTLTNKKEDDVSQDPADGKSVESSKKANKSESPANTPSRKKKIAEEAPSMSKPSKLRSDPYCWRCHWEIERASNEKAQVHQPVHCTVCPRSYHFKCLSGAERTKVSSEKNWVCPKCLTVLTAESSETRSPMMKKITLGMLCDLLKYALQRMMELKGVEPFMSPVDRTVFPDYDKYIVHAVDLSLMQDNIAQGVYGSTEAFVSDAQWILHNSIIFNTHVKSLRTGSVLVQAKLTQAAKWLVRSCRAEMGEIEACPECYAAAHARRPTWFTDVCSTPHILLWAKLKGFPYWPAKGMSVNSGGMVDVRFFGAHDRAWVPARDCFLYSEKDPNNFKAKRQDIIDAMQEAEHHIRNITRKFGKFIYPAFKVQFEPSKSNEQLKAMIPAFEPQDASPQKTKVNLSSRTTKKSRRSISKSSKDSYNDGEESNSESEEEGNEPVEKKTRRAVKVDKQCEDKKKDNKDGNKSMEVDVNTDKKEKSNAEKDKESLRKRRRSCLEEAVITVMSPTTEKRKRIASSDMTVMDKSKTETNQKKAENSAKDNKEISKNKSDENDVLNITKVTPKKAADETEKLVQRTTRASTPGSNLKQGNNKQIPRVDSPKVSTPKDADKVKKAKSVQREESSSSEKSSDEKPKNKANKSHTNIPKTDKNISKNDVTPSGSKEKSKGSESDSNKSDKITSTPKPKSAKGAKTALDDDDTILAVLAKKSVNIEPCFPTISNVRSLSQTDFTKVKSPKSTEVTEANSNSSIFTPTSTENVNNMKDAVAKLQKLRETDQPAVVGRVGVRAFARMTSPPAETQKTAESEKVEIEVKAEPMDYDDAERQSEKLDLLNTFRLRPVNPQNFPSLRDIRINKVAVTANAPNAIAQIRKPILVKPSDVRPKARKTFPQPQKSNEGRSELNCKNSMVYIPIQPPMTQAPRPPLRNNSSVNGPTSTPPALRPQITVNASSSNNIVNTVTTPLMTVVSMPSSLANASPSMPTITQMPNMGNMATVAQVGNMGGIGNIGTVGNMGPVGNMGAVSSMGSVGTVGGVHTVPLITSVNGQWTFSLQPMMSVGGVDSSPPPTMNGLVEPSLAPLSNVSNSAPALEPISSPLPNRTSSDNNPPGEPPRLQQKPTIMNPLDPNTPVSDVPVASSAGPITAKLNQNAVKLADFFRNLLEDSIEKLSPENASTQLMQAKVQLEQMHWRHKHEIDEIKHNHQLVLAEMRTSFDKEKNRLLQEQRRLAQLELSNAVKNTKTRQWCANCQQEAQFYCCWNTSYCDYPCQRSHWTQHFSSCTQQRTQDNGNDNSVDLTEDRLQPPENPPKTAGPVAMTVGGKLVPSRLYTQTNTSSGKAAPSIIVSMVDDTSGNPTVKCVGTYKPPNTPQTSSLLINKQIMNNEENAAKKVVTSGGYLIVGASAGGNQSVVIN